MDEYALQFSASAADAEGCGQNTDSDSKKLRTDEKQTDNRDQNVAVADELPTLNSMFGFAASWGRKLQSELQLDGFVDQVKKQSEEVAKAYSQDISEFAQAVRTGAVRGMDELSTRFNQLKADLETEANADKSTTDVERGVQTNTRKSSVFETLKKQQEKTKRLMNRLGTDLEDLLRDAIVIEAPGSASTEEQRNAARKIIYDRRMAQLAAIQESESTYLTEPQHTTVTTPASATKESSPKDEDNVDTDALTKKAQQTGDYDKFAMELSLNDKKDEMAQLLEANPAMADIYKRIVPDKVSETEFWTRYFYHVWRVEQEEIRRKNLVEAAVAATEEEEFNWDMDDDVDVSDVTNTSSKMESRNGDKHGSDSKADAKLAAESVPKTETASKTVDKTEDPSATESAKDDNAAKPSLEKRTEKKAGNNAEDDDAWDEWE